MPRRIRRKPPTVGTQIVNRAQSKELSRLAAIAGLTALAAFGGACSAGAADLVSEQADHARAWGAPQRPRFGFPLPPFGEASAPSGIAFAASAALDSRRSGEIGEAREPFAPSSSTSAVAEASWRDGASRDARGSDAPRRGRGAVLAAIAGLAVLLAAVRRFRNQRARRERAILRAVSIAGQRAEAEDPEAAIHAQIEAAAETSLWCGRSTGVVYINISPDGAAPAAERRAKLKRSAANAAPQIRRALGPVDFIGVLNGGGIVVCLPLLFGAAELRERAERLRDSVEELEPAGAPGRAKAGAAIYPLDGDDGASLIAVAVAKCRAARGEPQRSGLYALVEPARAFA
jgi:hypothetical protein